MILSDKSIKAEMLFGNIQISDFNSKRLNPNSYNLTLNEMLLVYDEVVLDPRKKLRTKEIKIPDEGLLLMPNKLYLGRTNEHTVTKCHIPMIEGRSSWGRLGLFVHVTAGFGDVGFTGYWTLEITCVQPMILYKNVEICQIFYHTVETQPEQTYEGKYQHNMEVQASKLHEELK